VTAAKLNSMSATNGQILKYNGTAWAPASDAGLTSEADGVIGNEVTAATTGGGLTRAGSGTKDSPYTLGIEDSGVTAVKIAAGVIDSTKIKAGGIGKASLAAGVIDSTKIRNATIGRSSLRDNSVITVKLQNLAVTDAKLAAGAVALAKMAANSVDSTKIVDKSIGSTDIANNAVITTNIRDANVTEAKLATGAVTAAKLNAMGATKGQALVYNGTDWVPTSVPLACSGAIVFNGAYTARDTLINGLTGSFAADWRSAVFSSLGDLCWAPANSSNKDWANAKAACAALTTDNARWRLPNLRELQVLYEAIGGSGSSATSFTNLGSKGIPNGAADMQSNSYWSSTEHSSDNAYYFNFSNGSRGNGTKASNYAYVRCVRSL
jgi:hypothetical protein